MLAARATSRLRQMVRSADDLDLQIVECSCRPGTEGTRWCNYGRACGYLTADGHDGGDVLVAGNLAHTLTCSQGNLSTILVISAGRTGASRSDRMAEWSDRSPAW
jgi:hypothetical protein